jgi:hypothetical protein
MGKQVANNTAVHYWVELWEDSAGELHCVKRKEGYALIRPIYTPIGKAFQFPKNWGWDKGCEYLLDLSIRDIQTNIKNLEIRLDKLTKAKEKING